MRGKRMKGIVDPITVAVIAGCFIVGGYFVWQKKHVDHPVEQVVEAVLESHGIDVDFSEGKKDD